MTDLNPVSTTMLGDMPKKDPSFAQFGSLSEMRRALGGDRNIEKILIANNGLAATKGIRSIQAWCYDHLGDADAVKFEAMATPDDLGVNAEFIRMAHHYTDVPGGSNANNYADVDLIVSTAFRQRCDAVYPGWGHASENPKLPRDLFNSSVAFLGPTEEAMFALGDKIASTIIAQSYGVPCVPWSGDHIRVPPGTLNIDDETYKQAYVASAEEAVRVVARVGLPVMLKASEGGGGKGIRKVYKLEEVVGHFEAVQEEVKGCHIFVMRMLENVRHLEVQLLADRHGQCIAVRTRDCSVQRRHQKIIEEGPVVGVDPAIVIHMERSAIRLAKAVGYCGLGTVEYMYNKDDGSYCFLELNPRIQVEHPVSELISGVNLPAALMCVGMGIPLHRVPEIRQYYGVDRYGDSQIPFDDIESLPSKCHAIAVRITAEDVDNGFRPTSGKIDDISFRNSRDCWGYFSVSSGGGIHQFADSQFGHVFATGPNRESARRSMALALRGINVRGEIRTSTAYVLELLEMPEFRDCDVSTAWLDRLIAERSDTPSTGDVFPSLAAASIIRHRRFIQRNAEKHASLLRAGHAPSTEYVMPQRSDAYVLSSTKYIVDCGRVAENEYVLTLNGNSVVAKCREFTRGALQLTFGGRNVVAYCELDGDSIRVTINGRALTFTGDSDPTKLRTSVPGRLVRYLVSDGEHVNDGAGYCEIEVMKMILPLKSTVAGKLHHRAVPGSAIPNGKLLAEVDPDDPSAVARAIPSQDVWAQAMHGDGGSGTTGLPSVDSFDAVHRARRGVDELCNLISGFHDTTLPLAPRLTDVLNNVKSLSIGSVSLEALNRPELLQTTVGTGAGGPSLSSPAGKLAVVISHVLQMYHSVEKFFAGKGRAEAMAVLKEAFKAGVEDEDMAGAFQADFAHSAPHRDTVVSALLGLLESERQVMIACRPALEALARLEAIGEVLLRARSLVRACGEPSFDERKTSLADKLGQEDVRSIAATSVSMNLMCSLLFDGGKPALAPSLLELIVQRMHYGEAVVSNFDVQQGAIAGCSYTASWSVAPDSAQTFVDPITMHTKAQSPSTSGSGSLMVKPGKGCLVLFEDDSAMLTNFSTSALVHGQSNHSSLLVMTSVRPTTTAEQMAQLCSSAIKPVASKLASDTGLEQVTFVCWRTGKTNGPNMFTFTRADDFDAEDTVFRDSHPTTINRLEMWRLKHYKIAHHPTFLRKIHIYHATPKVSTPANRLDNRLFVRTYLCPGDLDLAPWTSLSEVDCARVVSWVLAATDLARTTKALSTTVYNHLFVNLVELTLDLKNINQILKVLSKSFASRMFELGFREVELKFRTEPTSVRPSIPFRVFMSYESLHALSVQVYVEGHDEEGHVVLRRARFEEDVDQLAAAPNQASPKQPRNWGGSHGKSHSDITSLEHASHSIGDEDAPVASAATAPLAALRALLPTRTSANISESSVVPLPANFDCNAYPTLSAVQLRRLQAGMAGTTYVHDWSVLFESALRRQWVAFVKQRGLNVDIIPRGPLWDEEQLILDPSSKSLVVGKGKSSVGMVVWRVSVRSSADFDSKCGVKVRKIIVVANDLTTQSGSFSVAEDVVFEAASKLARSDGVPFVYLSANSGARLGLCQEVKKCFRVASRDDDAFEYIYLTDADQVRLTNEGVVVNTTPIDVNGETRHVLKDVVGNTKDYLGVENLQGSALTAGEMSLNYASIPTISVVSGRSVGIGAYLVRLGRRVIQGKSAPIILTGAGAINRLLGKEVYSSNNQLGGTQIMRPNGVSHFAAADDYDAVVQTIRWLDCVPAVCGPRGVPPSSPEVALERFAAGPRTISLPIVDPVDRDVTFLPVKETQYDPRCLVAGCPETGATGLLDKGSFVESLHDWAKTVAVGRGALGGIPCGVIIVETRATRKFDPADPADATSSAREMSQAGQVWFPDSARKTADALEDFCRERLPCIVIANWRGFSGGMRDMYDEVLKFGASIVDNLRVYDRPVFIYIPPFGELRGGAWVVVDPVINHNGCVSMYADSRARGGILEPSGIVEIKFRAPDVEALIRRDRASELASLDEPAAKAKIKSLMPMYSDVAVHFADLHDTPGRMKAKGCISEVVEWHNARRVFAAKLRRQLLEHDLADALRAARPETTLSEALRCVRGMQPDTVTDTTALGWLETTGLDRIVAKCKHAAAEVLAKQLISADIESLCTALEAAGHSSKANALRSTL